MAPSGRRGPLSPEALRRELLAGERGVVVKDPGGRLKVALIWPGSYRTGMSALGYLWTHGYLLSRPDVLSERCFGPPEGGLKAVTLESGRRLDDFDLVAASLTIENDYWMLPATLEAGGIPPLRRDRGPGHPPVIAGGVGVWSNPWPVMPFVDVVLAGEGEGAWPALADLANSDEFRKADQGGRLRLIRDRVPGALVPGAWPKGEWESGGGDLDFGEARYKPSGTARGEGIEPVVPAFLAWPPPEGLEPPVSPIVSKGAEFADTALVEISRGCPWGCRFCLAGFLYRPHRVWPVSSILSALDRWLSPGARAGLVSPAVADHPGLEEILSELQDREVSVSLSSMRLTEVTESLAGRLAKGGLKGLAVAPEGGSERLRESINKNLSEAEILSAARLLAFGGLRRLKLYFMIGLPGETEGDLVELARLSGAIRAATRIGRAGPQVAVSAANFTPKPHTPLEEAALMTEAEMRRKGERLAELIRREAKGVELRLDPPRWTLVQGLLARGGPGSYKLTEALWRQRGRTGPALKAYGYSLGDPVHREGPRPKPWRVVANRAGTGILESERAKAALSELSEPCPPELGCGRCLACGSGAEVTE
jgi:radical SAM superfamily enzyme YgiQ (UPF0313 family)